MVDAVLRADSSKVVDMHEARAGKMSDVIGEAIGGISVCLIRQYLHKRAYL